MNPNDTIVAVIVVPMFAPMIMGIALSSVRAPVATRATTNDVVVELLCSKAVITNPMNNPVKGFEVANKIVSDTLRFRC